MASPATSATSPKIKANSWANQFNECNVWRCRIPIPRVIPHPCSSIQYWLQPSFLFRFPNLPLADLPLPLTDGAVSVVQLSLAIDGV